MFEKLSERLSKVIEILENGGSIKIEYIINQHGEKIVSKEVSYDPAKGVFKEWGIACWNSADFGLGTCQCVSHDPTYETEISFERFAELIKNYLIKGLEEDLEHLQNKFKAQKLKETLANILNIVKSSNDIDELKKLLHAAVNRLL